jgi:predicted AlkP superfamily phosphohydrolase/phosphomutase
MVTGLDPGELGIYGFRDRRRGSYEYAYASSRTVTAPRLWDRVESRGGRSVVLAVPQTYPPPARMRGALVSCFLTPDASSRYTCPPGLRDELEARFGPYIMDVEDFRTRDKRALLQRIYRMTEQHFNMALWMSSAFEWDFFMMVDMGIDRFHHGFWKYIDPLHPRYEKGNAFEEEGRKFYACTDAWLGRMLDAAPADTTVLVVSDHGARSMKGGVCVNEWLLGRGYLALRGGRPSAPEPLSAGRVDWTRTRAWGEGGYYARIFLNVRGRDPEGIVEPGSEYDELRDEIGRGLEEMEDERGRPLGNRVLRPEAVYREVRGFPPDLMVLLGDLDYRSVGSLGTGRLMTDENDRGPDDANHAMDGIFVMSGGGVPAVGMIEGASVMDITPTVCNLLGLPYNLHEGAGSILGAPVEEDTR